MPPGVVAAQTSQATSTRPMRVSGRSRKLARRRRLPAAAGRSSSSPSRASAYPSSPSCRGARSRRCRPDAAHRPIGTDRASLQPRLPTFSPSAAARAAQTFSGIDATGHRPGSWCAAAHATTSGRAPAEREQVGADLGVAEVAAGPARPRAPGSPTRPRTVASDPAEGAEVRRSLARVVEQRGRGPAIVGRDLGREPAQRREALGPVRARGIATQTANSGGVRIARTRATVARVRGSRANNDPKNRPTRWRRCRNCSPTDELQEPVVERVEDPLEDVRREHEQEQDEHPVRPDAMPGLQVAAPAARARATRSRRAAGSAAG